MEIENLRNELRNRVPAFAKKVAPIYLLLDWKWKMTGTPSFDDIEQKLCAMINDLEAGRCITSGGLGVEIDTENHQTSLFFSLEETEFYPSIDFPNPE